MADEMKRVGRKLLIASLGVASVSYGACGSSSSSTKDAAADGAVADSGPESRDAATDQPADTEGGIGAAPDVSPDRQFIGNII